MYKSSKEQFMKTKFFFLYPLSLTISWLPLLIIRAIFLLEPVTTPDTIIYATYALPLLYLGGFLNYLIYVLFTLEDDLDNDKR